MPTPPNETIELRAQQVDRIRLRVETFKKDQDART